MSVANAVLRHLRRQLGPPVSDTELLSAYVERRSEEAFRSLIERHGPMVLGVCRRRLGNAHAAEDAFQATFLALVRSAGSVRSPQALAAWLSRTALRICGKSQAAAARRHIAEDRQQASSPADALAGLTARELLDTLDIELNRLPEQYRVPLCLVYWQGLPHAAAARNLGLSAGALQGRLDRGRQRLADRLRSRGMSLPALLVAPLASVAVSGELLARTATLAVPGAAIPATVLTLAATAGATKMLPIAGLTVLLVSAGLVGLAGGFGSPQAPPVKTLAAPNAPAAPPVAKIEPRVDVLGDALPEGAIARLGSMRFRPGGAIDAMDFSPDGERLACWAGTTFSKGSFTIWNTADGKLLRRVDLPKLPLAAMKWLPDGRGFAVIQIDVQEFYVWEFTNEGAPLPPKPEDYAQNVQRQGDVRAAAISPDGKWVAFGHRAADIENQPIVVYPLVANSRLAAPRVLGDQQGHGYKLIFSPNSELLFSLSRTQEPNLPGIPQGNAPAPLIMGKLADTARLVVREVVTGRERAAFDLPAASVNLMHNISLGQTIAVSPDGSTLIVGQDNGQVRTWDWQTAKERNAFAAHPQGDLKRDRRAGVISLALSSEGGTLATAGTFGSIRKWELPTGRTLGSADESLRSFLVVAIAPGKKLLAAGSQEGQIEIWDLATGKVHCPLTAHENAVERVFITADGRTVMTAGAFDSILTWDIATGNGKRKTTLLDVPLLCWPTGFTLDGRGLIGRDAWGMMANRKRFHWDTETGKQHELPASLLSPTAAFMTPPVRDVVLLLEYKDDTVRVHEWPTGRLRHVLESPIPLAPATNYKTNAGAISPDAKLIATVGEDIQGGLRGDGWIGLWKAENGEVLNRWKTSDAIYQHVAISPDGASLVVGGSPMPNKDVKAGQALLRFDTKSGDLAASYMPPGMPEDKFRYIQALAISPDGRLIAAAEFDHIIHVYDLVSGASRAQFNGHRNTVTSLTFTPDCRRLVSTSRDMTAIVWDLAK